MSRPAQSSGGDSQHQGATSPDADRGNTDAHLGDEQAELLAARILQHPDVVRLDGGPFGAVGSYLPGRRIVGVSLGSHNSPAEIAIVAKMGSPLPSVINELREIARSVLGDRPVDLVVSDIVDPSESGTTIGPSTESGPSSDRATPGRVR
ncbi:MAG: hypothetical protein ACRDRL_31590 [Sciscionella sp.]